MAAKKVVDEKNFWLEEKQGDLFTCDQSASLAHCVSADLRMGKGIAVIFKKKFGGLPNLTRQKKEAGEVAVLKKEERFIYYLITKEKYHNKPTYETLKKCLLEMKGHCEENNVKQLCMPRIGCGLDRLTWTVVRDIIKEVFSDSNTQICIYSF